LSLRATGERLAAEAGRWNRAAFASLR